MTEPTPHDSGVPNAPAPAPGEEPVWKEPPRVSPLAVLTLAVGVIALPTSICCWLFGLPVSALGIVLGIVTLVRFKSAAPGELTGKPLAIAGLVLSCLSLLMFVALIVFGLAGQMGQPRGY